MKIGDSTLRMCGRLEDCPAVTVEQLQPRGHVARVIGPWLQFRDDPEIGAEETCPDVRTKLFARAIRAILVIAAQIPVQSVACANPVGLMPISA